MWVDCQSKISWKLKTLRRIWKERHSKIQGLSQYSEKCRKESLNFEGVLNQVVNPDRVKYTDTEGYTGIISVDWCTPLQPHDPKLLPPTFCATNLVITQVFLKPLTPSISTATGLATLTQPFTSFFWTSLYKKMPSGDRFWLSFDSRFVWSIHSNSTIQTGNRPYKPEKETSLEFTNYSHARIAKTLQTKRCHKSGTAIMNVSLVC